MKLEEILIPKVQEVVKQLYSVDITPAQVQFQKTRADAELKALSQSVDEYLSCFTEHEMEETEEMGMSM